jgi:hypothetical protein
MSWLIIKAGIIDASLIIALSFSISTIFSLMLAYLSKFFIPDSKSYPYMKLAGEFCIVSVPFGITGMVSGFLTGTSRAPAVTALLPAILTIFGGLTVYLISKGIQTAILAGVSITIFSSSLLFGTIFGSLEREQFNLYQNSLAKKLQEVERESAIKIYRRSLGLPEEIEEKKTKIEDGHSGEKKNEDLR